MAVVAQGAAAQPRGAVDAVAFMSLIDQAEARSSAEDWAAAVPLWERIVAANPVNPRFWARLGAAKFNAHDLRGALPALAQAVTLGAGFPADHAYMIASAHAQLGDKEAALRWLDRAMTLGYRELAEFHADKAFDALRGDPRFARLDRLSANVAAMSRTEGWRHDLDFLLWQMDRIAVDPYRLHPRSWFEQQFARIVAAAAGKTDLALSMDLGRLLREVGDGHSGLMPSRTADWALSLPLSLQGYDDGVYIVAADPRYRDLVGAQVLSFGGRPIGTVVAAVADSVSRDNESDWVRLQATFRLRYTALLAAQGIIDERDGAVLRVRTMDGAERTVRVAADMSEPNTWNQKPNPPAWVNVQQLLPGTPPLYRRHPERPYWYEYLADKRTVYFGFNTVRNGEGETLAAFAERLRAFIEANRVDRLVMDLRWNNGGNTNLVPALLAAVIRADRINRKGRMFVLIGPRTFSAAQNTTSMFSRFTEATFVGEPTGSSPNFIGEEEPFPLPYSKVNVNLSTLRWQSSWPQDYRTWIAPTIYAPITFADIRANRDPAMDAVLALPIPD